MSTKLTLYAWREANIVEVALAAEGDIDSATTHVAAGIVGAVLRLPVEVEAAVPGGYLDGLEHARKRIAEHAGDCLEFAAALQTGSNVLLVTAFEADHILQTRLANVLMRDFGLSAGDNIADRTLELLAELKQRRDAGRKHLPGAA